MGLHSGWLIGGGDRGGGGDGGREGYQNGAWEERQSGAVRRCGLALSDDVDREAAGGGGGSDHPSAKSKTAERTACSTAR